jgi:hypothetical protein
MLDASSARASGLFLLVASILTRGQEGTDDMRSTQEEFGIRAEPDDPVRAIVTRLSRPHPSGGVVIEHAAILAEGADATAIVAWIIARAGQPEAAVSRAPTRGLHGTRMSRAAGTPSDRARRYVLPAGALT